MRIIAIRKINQSRCLLLKSALRHYRNCFADSVALADEIHVSIAEELWYDLHKRTEAKRPLQNGRLDMPVYKAAVLLMALLRYENDGDINPEDIPELYRFKEALYQQLI